MLLVWGIHPFFIIILHAHYCVSHVAHYPSLSLSLSLTHTHTHTHTPFLLYSTAPHRRPDPLNYQPSAITTMHTNPNFSRGTPGRSTYAYGSRRPPPVSALTRFEGTPTSEASSQPSPGPSGGGFFKRLIPSRFSRR